MTQVLLLPLIAYAACGLILSLAVHLLALAGFQPPGGNVLFVGLHIGIFPLWIPVVLISMKMAKGTRLSATWGWGGWSYWNGMFSGCPPWMKYMTYGFLIYAMVNFAIFFVTGVTSPAGKHVGGDPPSAVWRGFSGHWMVFLFGGLGHPHQRLPQGLLESGTEMSERPQHRFRRQILPDLRNAD